MKTRIITQYLMGALFAAIAAGGVSLYVSAQNTLPVGGANGIGWNPVPNVNRTPKANPVPAMGNPAPAPNFAPNGIGWNPGPMPVANPALNSPAPLLTNPVIPNQGIEKVIACGYDAEGIWRVIPLQVCYQYNGVQYNVTVLNAWDPWTDQWNTGVDQQAYNTDYYLNGVTYNYYAPLSTGTYYFNL